jgi:arsenite-transporting ATPase
LGGVNPFRSPVRHLFFTGKGGVGKTALACATALALADAGKRVLLVSTDPASNLDEMLATKLTNAPTSIAAASGLYAMNLDPERAAEDYRARVLAPYVGVKSEQELADIREQLSGACTTEIAAFDEFSELLAGGGGAAGFDHVIFDTAPTGHTLRLLQLPKAWTSFLDTNERGATCLGPHSGLTMQRDRFAAAMEALTDPSRTLIVLVTRPNEAALREAARTSSELRALDVTSQTLVVNATFHASDPSDAIARAFERRGADALANMPDSLRELPRVEVPLRGYDMVGLRALRALFSEKESARIAAAPPIGRVDLPSVRDLVDELASADHGLVMVMGKGGVGKTTLAAAIAVELAARDIPVHLSTTDPAAHVAATVQDVVPHLTVSRIDPVAETRAYTERMMERRGADLDEEGRALLREDLRSPCTEEVAVFHAFSRIVSEARRGHVVLDTAPTGHTLLLLDATGAYHREVTRGLSQRDAGRIVTPLMRLRDPTATKIILVTLPEPTPVSEAAQLQADLRRAGIAPFAWVINASLAATGTRDPLLRQRLAGEYEQIERVRREYAKRVAVVPWVAEEPVGPTRLRALLGRSTAGERVAPAPDGAMFSGRS